MQSLLTINKRSDNKIQYRRIKLLIKKTLHIQISKQNKLFVFIKRPWGFLSNVLKDKI